LIFAVWEIKKSGRNSHERRSTKKTPKLLAIIEELNKALAQREAHLRRALKGTAKKKGGNRLLFVAMNQAFA